MYRPSLDHTLVELQDPGGAWDTKSFMLSTSICAYTLAVLPSSISGVSWPVAHVFYAAFKKAQDEYGLQDIECLDSSSVVIHLMHAAWHHVSGNPQASWYVLGQAMNTALLMRLHDEKTYESMPFVESQLCRRAFWALYTGCQASCFLGDHPSIFNKSLFRGVRVPRYPKEFGPEDQAVITKYDGRQHSIGILTGFNANQDLWKAAENLLQAVREGDSVDTATSDSRLATSYFRFCAILDDLPTALRFHNSVDITLEGFSFAKQGDYQPRVPQALAIQRTNLHISHQYLKLFFLRNYSFLGINNPLAAPKLPNLSPGTDSQMSLSQSDLMAASPTSRLSSNRGNQAQPQTEHVQRSLGAGLDRQILQIAEDMLYVIHTSGLDSLRLNGEPCTEKIRHVAASVLEVLAQDVVDPSLLERAVNLRDLYPHLLARLESKASDERRSTAAGGPSTNT
ncbi:Fungal-trans domain-containing protein [Fusarium falciforme]|uniref:Fungal-trans domain-containing protein n=1 Tax=Fusarium falciforme TaxID=195108 RepID=UPI0023005C56|nr:Fungal-trans domain-containing protein [Fusarium falciforme]WAO94572.1 Fungal-trans domain-containing protein [Fusarium falciforme]